jgi:6-phosphogluconolactonase
MKTVTVVLHRLTWSAMAGFLLLFLSGAALAQNREDGQEGNGRGRVYVMTNLTSGNTVIVFNRNEDGALTKIQEAATGGLGSGPGVLPPPLPPNHPGPDPLQSQDAIKLTQDGRYLLVANSGSNEISVFAVTDDGLSLTDKVASGGSFPNSIATHEDLVYALNAGESPDHPNGSAANIAGFLVNSVGKLHSISNSIRVLSSDAGASEVLFSPDGKQLIVTEMFTNTIDMFSVGKDGLMGSKISIPSNNPTPFGASFGRNNVLALTEIDVIVVNGRRQGVPNASTVSSYQVTGAGTLEIISKSIPSVRTGSCWLRFSKDGRFAYSADTGSGTISIFGVSPQGELSLVGLANTGGAFSAPLDLDVTQDGRFLYVLIPLGLVEHVPPILPLPSGTGRIQGFRVERDGSLTPVNTVGGLPLSSQGIVAR